MSLKPFVRILPLVAALSLAGGIVFVQPSSARAADQPAPAAGPAQTAATSAGVEATIARLRRRLHITDAQRPQWNALAAAMRENARRIELSRADRAKIHPTNVIDILYADRREAQARLQRLERVIPVAEALYAVLTPEQRVKADALFGGLMRRHRPILDMRD